MCHTTHIFPSVLASSGNFATVDHPYQYCCCLNACHHILKSQHDSRSISVLHLSVVRVWISTSSRLNIYRLFCLNATTTSSWSIACTIQSAFVVFAQPSFTLKTYRTTSYSTVCLCELEGIWPTKSTTDRFCMYVLYLQSSTFHPTSNPFTVSYAVPAVGGPVASCSAGKFFLHETKNDNKNLDGGVSCAGNFDTIRAWHDVRMNVQELLLYSTYISTDTHRRLPKYFMISHFSRQWCVVSSGTLFYRWTKHPPTLYFAPSGLFWLAKWREIDARPHEKYSALTSFALSFRFVSLFILLIKRSVKNGLNQIPK